MNGSIEAETKNDSSSEQLGVTALSWCQGRFEPPTLVIAGSSSKVSVYSCSNESRQWHLVAELPGHAKGVYDVAWAPNVGRSYHLIASTGTDNMLKVYRLKRKLYSSASKSNKVSNKNTANNESNDGTKSNADTSSSSTSILEYESSQVLDTGVAEVWRCSWNVTGTVLASSGDNGIVQLWKCDFRDDKWKCVSKVQGGGGGNNMESEQTLQMSM